MIKLKSVRVHIRNRVKATYEYSNWNSISISAWNLVWDSILNSVRDLVWDSVGDSIRDAIND